MTPLFEKACFIGIGLIGSSLARVIKRDGLARRVVGVARSFETRKAAVDLGVADEMTDDIALAVADADLVVLCTPVGVFQKVMVQAMPFLKDGCIVTDVGSVKNHVISQVMPFIPKNVSFVPAHPVAGTEKSGVENGFDTLFEGRWCLITPCEKSSGEAVEKIKTMWESAGMRVDIMDAARHDAVMAVVSHVPHLIAFATVNTAKDMERESQQDIMRFGAGGFRDFTRIAASDPVMWRDIFLENADAVLDVIDRFSVELEKMKQAVMTGDGAVLERAFARASKERRHVATGLETSVKSEKSLLPKR